jgi:hypothetical protein
MTEIISMVMGALVYAKKRLVGLVMYVNAILLVFVLPAVYSPITLIMLQQLTMILGIGKNAMMATLLIMMDAHLSANLKMDGNVLLEHTHLTSLILAQKFVGMATNTTMQLTHVMMETL